MCASIPRAQQPFFLSAEMEQLAPLPSASPFHQVREGMPSWHVVCTQFLLSTDSSAANETLEPTCPLPMASGFLILFLALISYSCSVPGVSSHLPSAKLNSAYSRNLSNPYRNSCSIRLLTFLFKIHHYTYNIAPGYTTRAAVSFSAAHL